MNSTHESGVNIPPYIQDKLNEPAPGNPGRHQAWIDLSLQMVGEGIPDREIFAALREWIPDKDKRDHELWDCIKGAHARNPKPATVTTGRRDRATASSLERSGGAK